MALRLADAAPRIKSSGVCSCTHSASDDMCPVPFYIAAHLLAVLAALPAPRHDSTLQLRNAWGHH
jgi:hypothetical protein